MSAAKRTLRAAAPTTGQRAVAKLEAIEHTSRSCNLTNAEARAVLYALREWASADHARHELATAKGGRR